MAGDDRPKPSIPAWQRAQHTREEAPAPAEPSTTTKAEQVPQAPEWEDAEPASAEAEETSAAESSTQDPHEAASTTTDARTTAAISTTDFDTFQKQQTPPTPLPKRQQPAQGTGPPIITYPEFLVEAHKPPPLITLSRIWNTAYIASGVTALLYGASKYLVKPMSDSLTHARHDFATHSLSKVDEMNERLSKLVSKVPPTRKDVNGAGGTDEHSSSSDETESEASDPSELFHRNIGTQTSPLPSRQNSMGLGGGTATAAAGEARAPASPTDYHADGLRILREHLSDMLDRSTSLEVANKERQKKMDELLSYLDTVMYASPAITAWAAVDHAGGAKDGDGDGSKEDAVDELKKEIRAIKGLMLSAKRFPGRPGVAT